MSRYELTKSVEVRKLNKRSGLPLPEPPVIIPFGSVISDLKRDRGQVRFFFLFELYEVAETIIDSALRPVGAEPEPAAPPDAAPEPAAEAPAAEPSEPSIWQLVSSSPVRLYRAQVPGGWLLATGSGPVTFYPDAGHAWE